MRLRPPRHARPLSGVRYNPNAMRRVLRILLNAATVLSLMLCVATVGLWVRSYIRYDWLQMIHGPAGEELTAYHGRLIYLHWDGIPSAPSVRFDTGRTTPVGTLEIESRSDRRLLGVTVPHGPVTGPDADWWPWACPFWLLTLITGAVPVGRFWLTGTRRGQSGSMNCAHCGYDLRATPDRCPECGAVSDHPAAR
jgi:hypothetical protein